MVGNAPMTLENDPASRYAASTTNRSINHECTQPSQFGIVSGLINAAVAPLMEVLKPTRKEETISNARIYGDAGTTVSKGHLANMSAAKTTMKETTLYTPTLTMNGTQQEGGYVSNHQALNHTQRETTSCGYIGTAGSAHTMGTSYASNYEPQNAGLKSLTENNTMAAGGTQIFNPMNTNVGTLPNDTTRYDGRFNPAHIGGLTNSLQQIKQAPSNHGRQVEDLSNRNDASLLKAFKQNPYTHTLTGIGETTW
jgi:hypothetical protein